MSRRRPSESLAAIPPNDALRLREGQVNSMTTDYEMDKAMTRDEEFLDQTEAEFDWVLPGEEIVSAKGFLCGHGTYVDRVERREVDGELGIEEESDNEDGELKLVASLAGAVRRINKLVSVESSRGRYEGSVGDVVIGRIIEVGNKQWKVDLGARKPGKLMLGSVNLPGGELRRRTIEDRLLMRTLFAENDIISAEVAVLGDQSSGSVPIHTRSLRYGKLENGVLVTVPSTLTSRLNQHFSTLPCGVDAIFAVNGRIWLTAQRRGTHGLDESAVLEQSRMADHVEKENKHHADRVFDVDIRLTISRVRNSIKLLASWGKEIEPTAIMKVFRNSELQKASPMAMLTPKVSAALLESYMSTGESM